MGGIWPRPNAYLGPLSDSGKKTHAMVMWSGHVAINPCLRAGPSGYTFSAPIVI
jgi:hypothetical protein